MNIYVGNISYDASEEDLSQLFGEFGEVTSAKIISDKFTGRSKGFGFVEMTSKEGGEQAVGELNGRQFKGRALIVSEARPQQQNGGGGGGRPDRGGDRGDRRPPRRGGAGGGGQRRDY